MTHMFKRASTPSRTTSSPRRRVRLSMQPSLKMAITTMIHKRMKALGFTMSRSIQLYLRQARPGSGHTSSTTSHTWVV